jgi:hypothetical protein
VRSAIATGVADESAVSVHSSPAGTGTSRVDVCVHVDDKALAAAHLVQAAAGAIAATATLAGVGVDVVMAGVVKELKKKDGV